MCSSDAMRNRRPGRLRNFDYLGKHRYFVTCCVSERRTAFIATDRVDCVRKQILQTSLEGGFKEIASVYMPDHVHALFRGTRDDAAFVPFMTVLRQRTTIAYKKLSGELLWQDGYFDRVLRTNDDTCAWVAYILENPVRAGLVEHREDYPFSYRRDDVDADN